ncbi:MAG: peroxidase-related enzyme [Caldimonas sp.]
MSDAATAEQAPAPIRRNGFTNESLEWHSWLQPLEIANASPLQLEVLDESHPQSRTSAYYLTLAHQPLMLRHRSTAYNAIMYAPGGLPRAERELGAMLVSVTNACVYCTSVHAQRFAQLARRHDTVEQVFEDPASAGTTERERAIARFAIAVTVRPQALAAEDIAPLRAVGMNDEEIIDLLHAVAIFGWANRLMQNLGEPAPVA